MTHHHPHHTHLATPPFPQVQGCLLAHQPPHVPLLPPLLPTLLLPWPLLPQLQTRLARMVLRQHGYQSHRPLKLEVRA